MTVHAFRATMTLSNAHTTGPTVPPSSNAKDTPAAWIPLMVDRIVERFRPLKIVLFGSHARGDEDAESDIDLLVVMSDEFRGVRQRETAIAILATLADLPVYKDVVVTTPDEIARRGDLPGTVLYFALEEGKTLHERSAS